jgi:hypothetical protein
MYMAMQNDAGENESPMAGPQCGGSMRLFGPKTISHRKTTKGAISAVRPGEPVSGCSLKPCEAYAIRAGMQGLFLGKGGLTKLLNYQISPNFL